MYSQRCVHVPHKWGGSIHTHRVHTQNTSESIIHHKSRTLFAGGPPRSPQCTTSQNAPKFSSLPAGGDETGRRRAPPGVTVHRRAAYTSHSRAATDCEEEAFEATAFFEPLGIVAVEEQQRKSGSREVNRESRDAPPLDLRYQDSLTMIHVFFRFIVHLFPVFPVLLTRRKQGSSFIYESGAFHMTPKTMIVFHLLSSEQHEPMFFSVAHFRQSVGDPDIGGSRRGAQNLSVLF